MTTQLLVIGDVLVWLNRKPGLQ